MKSAVLIPALALAISFFAGSVAFAQPSPATGNSAPQQDPVDAEWDALRMAVYAQPAEMSPATDELSLKAALAKQAAQFRGYADKAKTFYTKNPKHAKATDARKLEVVMLIQAVQAGDTSIEGRAEKTALDFTTDKDLPEAHRAEVAGVKGFTKLSGSRLQGAERQAALENVARSLMLSFPGQPQGYESLLTIAQDAESDKQKALLDELLASPAPTWVKENARTLLERRNLVGKTLAGILEDAGARELQAKLKEGLPTVVYTWASWSPGSGQLGEMLAKRNVGAANIVGLNLDTDSSAADALKQKHGLPGLLHRDNRGANGALAKALKVTGAPQVYLIDAQGVIRDVRGTDGLEQKLGQLGL